MTEYSYEALQRVVDKLAVRGMNRLTLRAFTSRLDTGRLVFLVILPNDPDRRKAVAAIARVRKHWPMLDAWVNDVGLDKVDTVSVSPKGVIKACPASRGAPGHKAYRLDRAAYRRKLSAILRAFQRGEISIPRNKLAILRSMGL